MIGDENIMVPVFEEKAELTIVILETIFRDKIGADDELTF
jgi:hypothetical protein